MYIQLREICFPLTFPPAGRKKTKFKTHWEMSKTKLKVLPVENTLQRKFSEILTWRISLDKSQALSSIHPKTPPAAELQKYVYKALPIKAGQDVRVCTWPTVPTSFPPFSYPNHCHWVSPTAFQISRPIHLLYSLLL